MAEPGSIPMTPEQLAWMSQNNQGPVNERGVQSTHASTDQSDLGRGNSSKPRGSGDLPFIRPEETSLMHCVVGDVSAAKQVWEEACRILVQDLNNVDPMILPQSKAIGNYYQHGSFCEFLMALYQSPDNQHVLDFKRMSGDGFVMDAFFRKMKEPLDATGHTLNPGSEIDGETDDDDDMDMFDDYSSDEDEDETDFEEDLLKPGGYLKMSADKNLVIHWMHQVQNRHIEDQNHIMGLMAHNSKQKENKGIMLEHLAAMLEMITKKLLDNSSGTGNAALVRNASVLLYNLLLGVTELPAPQKNDLCKAIFQAIQTWCPEEQLDDGKESPHLKPVSQSRETVKYLSMVVASLRQNAVFTDEELNSSRDSLEDTVDFVAKTLQNFDIQKAQDLEQKDQAPLISKALAFFATAGNENVAAI